MNKNIISILCTILCLLIIATCTGCSSTDIPDNDTPVSVAIVWGCRANTPTPTLPQELKKQLTSTAYNGGNVTIIVCDGQPYVTGKTIPFKPLRNENLSNAKKQTIVNNEIEQVYNMLKVQKAKSPEADPLAALDLATKSLRKFEGEKYICFCDSGLGTKGYMNYIKGWLNADSKAVIDMINKYDAIPDFNDITLYCFGLGYTCTPQQNLRPKDYKRLISHYEELFRAGGAKKTYISKQPISGDSIDNLPYVTPVPIQEDNPEKFIETEQKNSESYIKLDEEKLLFYGDSAVLKNHDQARKVLKPYAASFIKNNISISLFGTTAKVGTSSGCYKLSKERANTVKKILVELGVNDDIISSYGLGFSSSLYIDDNNGQNEQNAKLNRAVYIYKTDSKQAKRLRKEVHV
jgi:outer membrane protein OmpA-like peptidoglycan-associated protein